MECAHGFDVRHIEMICGTLRKHDTFPFWLCAALDVQQTPLFLLPPPPRTRPLRDTQLPTSQVIPMHALHHEDAPPRMPHGFAASVQRSFLQLHTCCGNEELPAYLDGWMRCAQRPEPKTQNLGTSTADSKVTVTFEPGKPGILCCQSRLNCKGCFACERVDPTLLDVVQRDLDPTSRDAVFAAQWKNTPPRGDHSGTEGHINVAEMWCFKLQSKQNLEKQGGIWRNMVESGGNVAFYAGIWHFNPECGQMVVF
ncbi:hypothetical protein B0H10DRAFT_1968913 [Mycena sp. CBHHK59/15]|nr:hypothetical protein B0H10DRAFT_1968913 [Mycena sp. CBHHK59/15]